MRGPGGSRDRVNDLLRGRDAFYARTEGAESYAVRERRCAVRARSYAVRERRYTVREKARTAHETMRRVRAWECAVREERGRARETAAAVGAAIADARGETAAAWESRALARGMRFPAETPGPAAGPRGSVGTLTAFGAARGDRDEMPGNFSAGAGHRAAGAGCKRSGSGPGRASARLDRRGRRLDAWGVVPVRPGLAARFVYRTSGCRPAAILADESRWPPPRWAAANSRPIHVAP
jgi:hypothetical protein